MYYYIKMKAKNAAAMKSLTITLKLPLLPGSLSTARSTCGKPQCPCHRDPARRHGLYYRWTGLIDGTRTTRTISRTQAQQCLARFCHAAKGRWQGESGGNLVHLNHACFNPLRVEHGFFQIARHDGRRKADIHSVGHG